MPQEPKEHETATVEQLTLTNAYQLEAFQNVWSGKGC